MSGSSKLVRGCSRRLRLTASLAAAVLAAAIVPTHRTHAIDLGDVRPIIHGPGAVPRGVATRIGSRTWLATAHTVRGLPWVQLGNRLKRRAWTHDGLDAALVGGRDWRATCHAPAQGEAIRLHTFPRTKFGRATFAGRVVSVSARRLRFTLAPPADPIPGWSGAPLTSPAGHLVGILMGRLRGTNVLAASRCDAIKRAIR